MKRQVLLFLCLIITFFSLTGLTQVALADNTEPASCAEITSKQPHSSACNAEIAAHPVPDLERPVNPDPSIDGRSRPRSIMLPTDPLPYPIGWVLRDSYYSDGPGKDPVLTPDRLYHKADLVFVYAEVRIGPLEWKMIGPDQWIDGEFVSALHLPKRPDGVSGRWITLDLKEQTLVASIDDKPIFATLISAGYDGFGFTHPGLYHIYARTPLTTFRGPPWAKIPEYIIPNVPDAMFFDHDVALHGAYWHNYFGLPRTHGCVNIPVGDEKWLWNWVSQTADQWGPDTGSFFMAHPDKAPFVFVWRSPKVFK